MKINTLISVLAMLSLVLSGAGCLSENGEETAIPAGEVEVEEKVEAGGSENEIFDTQIGEVRDAKFDDLMEDANSNYVEALISTSKKDYNSSEKALEGLVEKLTVVSEGYVQNPPSAYADDEKWPETAYEAVDIAVNSREYLLRNDIEAAHEALEPMRDLFLELHRRNGIDLMGDRLTEFHTIMEIAIEDANKNDTDAVAALIPELEARWETVASAEPPESADEDYEASLEAVELKIHELETAAALNDEEETIKAAEEMRQAFAQVFAKYGVVIA